MTIRLTESDLVVKAPKSCDINVHHFALPVATINRASFIYFISNDGHGIIFKQTIE